MKFIRWRLAGERLLSLKKLKTQRVFVSKQTHHSEGKKYNQFLYVMEGCYLYRFMDGKRVEVKAGNLFYIPKGSRFIVEPLLSESKNAYVHFIDFMLVDAETNEEVGFEEEFRILFEEAPRQIVQSFEGLSYYTPLHLRNTYLKGQQLFFTLLYDVATLCTEPWITRGSSKKIVPAVVYLRKHFEENISIEDLAERCGYKPARFRAVFKLQSGLTPSEYRNKLRMEKACELLSQRNLEIGAIAEMVGFRDVFYFSKCFKKTMGVTPSAYRKKISN